MALHESSGKHMSLRSRSAHPLVSILVKTSLKAQSTAADSEGSLPVVVLDGTDEEGEIVVLIDRDGL